MTDETREMVERLTKHHKDCGLRDFGHCDCHVESVGAEAAALLERLAPKDGTVVVPREPTMDMLHEGIETKLRDGSALDIYRAMLAARPDAQGEPGDEDLGSCIYCGTTFEAVRPGKGQPACDCYEKALQDAQGEK